MDTTDDDGQRVYAVEGELFASQFDYVGDPHDVVIDLTNASAERHDRLAGKLGADH